MRTVFLVSPIFASLAATLALSVIGCSDGVDGADKVATENFMAALGLGSQSFDETLLQYRELFVTAGAGFPMVGTPEQIVQQMGEMAEAGIDGFALGFYDYYDELGFFGENVMPLLRKAGLHE